MADNKVNCEARQGEMPKASRRVSGDEDSLAGKVIVTRSIEIVTAEIHTIRDNAAKVFMDAVVQIGRRLEEAKQLVPQGGWTEYLENELGYKPSTAQNYMRIAREFGDGQVSLSGKTAQDVFGDLGYAQLLPLLGLPEEEREELAGEHDLAGMSSREIAALVKERDALAAKAEKLNEAEQAAVEAKEKLKAEKDKAREAQALVKEADEKAALANRSALDLRKQLEELTAKADQPRPLTEEELARVREEVAAEQKAAVEAAEQRAAEMEKKLEKVKNPAAHQVNFLFGELSQTHTRLVAAVAELAKTDTDAAERMRGAINQAVKEWTV